MKYAILAAALTLAACSPQPAPASEAAAAAPAAETPAAPVVFKASGLATTIAAEKEDMDAAWVTDVRMIKDVDAKISVEVVATQ